MQLKNSTPVLFVDDIERSKIFYTSVLGMAVVMDFGINVTLDSGIALWQIPLGHQLGAHNKEAVKTGYSPFELCFETNDLDQAFAELHQAETRFLHEIHEENWGQRTVRFFDPDGHLVEIGEAMHVFVQRFHHRGMSPEEVSARTSVPLAEVVRLLAV